jgi:hypothetical protein
MEMMPCDPDRLSRLELVSRYINEYYTLDADRRSKFEAAFRKRRIPLPLMPEAFPVPRRAAPMDRNCLLSYFLLIYSGTAIFYSWIYLFERLVKMDFGINTKHKLIQSGIALFYVLAEIFIYAYFSGAD